MPTVKQENQITKRALRKINNSLDKETKAHLRQQALIALGKTVIVTEEDGVKKYAFPPNPVVPPSPPRLVWLNGKMFKHGDPRKSRSSHKPENLAAFDENASRTLAKEVEKALAPAISVDTKDASAVI